MLPISRNNVKNNFLVKELASVSYSEIWLRETDTFGRVVENPFVVCSCRSENQCCPIASWSIRMRDLR